MKAALKLEQKKFQKLKEKYQILSLKDEGTFSKVYKAKCLETGQLVAVKHLSNIFRTSYEARKVIRELSIFR